MLDRRTYQIAERFSARRRRIRGPPRWHLIGNFIYQKGDGLLLFCKRTQGLRCGLGTVLAGDDGLLVFAGELRGVVTRGRPLLLRGGLPGTGMGAGGCGLRLGSYADTSGLRSLAI